LIGTIDNIDREELMDLRQLTTYRVLARTLNFHQAAEQLHCVQSTVTAQIQALEDELGARLFDRLGRRVVLTDAGTRLVAYADRLLNLADEARLAVSGREEEVGTLTISATETLCTYRLPAVLHRFRSYYPQVRIVFLPQPIPNCVKRLQKGHWIWHLLWRIQSPPAPHCMRNHFVGSLSI
jgi:DNA-binding transcriptional LysR family regulator